MNIEIQKITNIDLVRRACGATTGKDSKITLSKIYKCEHSPIRTQLFWIDITDMPLFVASQLVRSHVGVQFFQLSKRTDRGGEDFRAICQQINDKIKSSAVNIESTLYSADDTISCLDSICDEIQQLPSKFDRYTPTDLSFIINAEALINMAKKRLCTKASPETREVMMIIKEKIKDVDPDLYNFLVPTCIYRGGICPELKSCKFCKTDVFAKILNNYRSLFA